MTKRLILITLVLLGVGNVFSLKQGQADPGGVPAQIARLQATVNLIKNSLSHIDPTIIGETTLTTGMLFAALNDRIACNVVNVSETEVVGSISIISSFGDVVLNNTAPVLSHRAVGVTVARASSPCFGQAGSLSHHFLAGSCLTDFVCQIS